MSRSEATALIAIVLLGVGIVGFLMSLGWSKATGRDLDRDKVIFLAKAWGAFVAVFIVLDLIR
jgi:hypothetical protein